MKNVLLSTSAIALVGAASAAQAAEWNLRWGGFSNQSVGYGSSDVEVAGVEVSDSFVDVDGVDTLSDTEIIFRPSITLDNGLEFGLQVQLEGNTEDDQIDESFVSIDGSFGRVLIGSENSAGFLMQIAAPCVSVNCHNSGSLSAYIPFSGGDFGGTGAVGGAGFANGLSRGTLFTTFLENQRNNDVGRISYFTPRFFGLQFGFSYARDDLQDDDTQVNQADDYGDIIDIGLNYDNSFGDFDVAASARWGIQASTPEFDDTATLNQDETKNPQVYGFGASVGFAGFTIGGSFAEQNNSQDDDGTAWDIGIAYETGPWGFSFSYLDGENVDDDLSDGDFVLGADESAKYYVAAVNYALAKGVDLNLYGAYVDFEEDFSDADEFIGEPGGEAVNGFVIAGAIALSF